MADMHIKVDSDVKIESEAILRKIGISMSDLVNMTLRRVIYERKIPFDTQIPDIEMPDSVSISSLEELDSMLVERISGDDGSRYTIDEAWQELDMSDKRAKKQDLSYV